MSECVKLKNTCVFLNNEEICLKPDHAYYCQVHMQIFVSNLYCDFVIVPQYVFLTKKLSRF